jgi:hypothetical protein
MAKRKNNKLKIKLATSGVIYYYLKGRRLKSAEGQAIQAAQFEKRSIAAKKAAANAAIMASLRAANPLPEIATGSPYQAARESWLNTDPASSGVFDHWTSNKD